MWYSEAYRRHLCDMHIDDWDDSFLSQFSPEVYVENLKTAKIQNAMLYLQSHVGLCYYPTKIGVMHRAFRGREDLMKQTERLCHENGIAVTGYYSLNYNTTEHDRHPEWRMVQSNGRSRRDDPANSAPEALAFASTQRGRYGLCCPNNMDYRAFVYRQIDEMLAYFKVEGMFFDMPFWPHTCHCSACRARWEKEVGTPFPSKEPALFTEEHLQLMRAKHRWMGEWIGAVTDYVKSVAPAVSVEHNFAQGIAGDANCGCANEVNAACDFVGGDLYGDIFNHSLACKFYKNATKNAPFDYMFSRCKPALRAHTLTKSEDEMRLEVMTTAAHHGATMVIDAIDPVGTMDRRVYERIGRVFGEQASLEPYFKGQMAEDIGLYYGIKSRFGKAALGFDSKAACIGASKALISAHIPFGVTGSFYKLDGYRALVVPMLSAEEADDERLLAYVREGGCLYFSGARCEKLFSALTGAKFAGYTAEKNVYIAPKKEQEALFGGFNAAYPLPFDAIAPKAEGVTNGEVLATLTLPYTAPDDERFASIHSTPPGIATAYPTVIEGSYGKGRFIWSALPLEGMDMEDYRVIFLGLLDRLTDKTAFSFRSTAPDDVELTLFEDADAFYLHAVHMDERVVMKSTAPFAVSVRFAGKVAGVEHLPDQAPVGFTQQDGYVTLQAASLRVCDTYRIRKA